MNRVSFVFVVSVILLLFLSSCREEPVVTSQTAKEDPEETYLDRPILSEVSGVTLTQGDIITITPPEQAEVHYTMDGSEPTTDSPSDTTISLADVLGDVTIKVMALKDGINSKVKTINITVRKIKAPTFNLKDEASVYTNYPIMATSEEGTTIRYTVDRTTPTATHGYESNRISRSGMIGSVWIKAVAVKNGVCSDVSVLHINSLGMA